MGRGGRFGKYGDRKRLERLKKVKRESLSWRKRTEMAQKVRSGKPNRG